jgi:hypothetical protein
VSVLTGAAVKATEAIMLADPDLGFVDGGVDFLHSATYGACGARFGVASRLPSRTYTSAVFQELENEKVWTRDWVCIGASAEIPMPGDLLPYTVGRHAIHVQRLPDNGLMGRFNKAQHGGCRSIPAQCRTGRKTKCSYTSCGHSRDRMVIPGDQLNEMTPQAGQYLGVTPERLMPVKIHLSGPLLFANIDPTLDRDIGPPLEADAMARAVRTGGGWQEHHANWKLAGAALVDTARSHPAGGGAINDVSAQWHFPNLVVITARQATLAIVLQPTAFDQALWRLSLFNERPGADAAYDQACNALLRLVDVAAARAIADQAAAALSAVCDVTEHSRAAWKFNQHLLQRINAQHAVYWNAPLTRAWAR